MKKNTEKGSILLFVIALILFISVLVLSFSKLVDRPGKHQADEVAIDRAMHLAQSGVNWAAATMATIPEAERTLETFQNKLTAHSYEKGDGEQGEVILTGFARGNNDEELWVNAKATVQGNTYTMDKRLWFVEQELPPGDFVISQLGSKMTLDVGTVLTGDVAAKDLEMLVGSKIEGNAIIRGDVKLSAGKILDNPKSNEKKEGNVCAQGKLEMETGSEVQGNAIAHELLALSTSKIGGNASTDGDMPLSVRSEIGGNATAKGNMPLSDHSKIGGNAISGGNMPLSGSSEIGGNATAGGNMPISGSSEIGGNATAGGNMPISGGSEIGGNAISGGNMPISGGSKIGGDVTVDKNLTISGGSIIGGNVTVHEELRVRTGARIGGNVTVYGKVMQLEDCFIGGSIYAKNDLEVGNKAIVAGNIHTTGNVKVTGDVNGYIHTTGDVTVSGNVSGYIQTEGNVEITGNVSGYIQTTGDVTVSGNVSGYIHTTGQVVVNGKVTGDIYTKGPVRIVGVNAMVAGNIHTKRWVKVAISGEVRGDIYADGNVYNGGCKVGDVDEEGAITGGKIQGSVYTGGNFVTYWGTTEKNVHAKNDIKEKTGGKILGEQHPNTNPTSPVLPTPQPDPPAPPVPPVPPVLPAFPTLPKLQNCGEKLCQPRLLPETDYPPAGNEVLFRTHGESIKLAPGSYDEIKISGALGMRVPLEKNATNLFLTTGTYYFTKVNRAATVPNLHFYLDLSGRQANPDYKGINMFFKEKGDWQRGIRFFVRKDPGGPYYPLTQTEKAEHFAHVKSDMGIDIATETVLSEADAVELAKYVYTESLGEYSFLANWEWLGTILANKISLAGIADRWAGSYNSLEQKGGERVATTKITFSPAEYINSEEGLKRWKCPAP